MWKHILSRGLRYNQPNASSKKLILSVLNSTATKREARDYLTKYTNDSNAINHCLLLIRDLHFLTSNSLLQLSGAIKRLRMLGLRPICIIPPSHHVTTQAEMLDQILTKAELRPLHLKDALLKRSNGTYESILASQVNLFDNQELNVIPIIKPYIYDERTATESMTKDLVAFMDNFSKGKTPYIDKFFILNKSGGIPSGERHDNAHVFINLSQEYDSLAYSLTETFKSLAKRQPESENLLDRLAMHLKEDELASLEMRYKDHLQDLQIMNVVLTNLSSSSTGLITTIRAAALTSDRKNPLLYNLLTDRSLISSSLPRFKKRHGSLESCSDDHSWYELPPVTEEEEEDSMGETDRFTNANSEQNAVLVTTVLKKGVYIKMFDHRSLTQFNSIGLPQELHITETPKKTSFDEGAKVDLTKLKRILDQSFNRDLDLQHYLNRINGRIASIIVIGDYEGIAILTYEGPKESPFVYLDKFAVLPHLKGSLGISDIIFNLMFKLFPKELLWRSRKDNVVNKWYFQRSVGVLDLSIDLSHGDKKPSQFNLFYYGDPELANNCFHTTQRLVDYATYVRDIEPSWVK